MSDQTCLIFVEINGAKKDARYHAWYKFLCENAKLVSRSVWSAPYIDDLQEFAEKLDSLIPRGSWARILRIKDDDISTLKTIGQAPTSAVPFL